MELLNAIKSRQSIKKFKDRSVAKSDLRNIVKIARWSPSSGNLQAYKVLFVRDQKKKDFIASASAHQDFIADAPVVMIVCAMPEKQAERYGDRGRELYTVQDATIFASYFQLVLRNYGMVSTWVGAFREGRIKEELDLDEDLRPVIVMPFGYPVDNSPKKRTRRNIKDIIL